MEPTVMDDIYFISEVWTFVNEIVIMEDWTMVSTILDDKYFIDLEFWMCVNEIVIMEALTNGAYSIG